MANVKDYQQQIQKVKSGALAPIYLLHGEEPYYADRLCRLIENHAVEEHERDFNLSVIYGAETNKNQLIELARRFPMMALRQAVIVREAQSFGGRWADMLSYFENPTPTTVLVVCMRGKKVDDAKWVKAIEKNGVVFHSSPHYENELLEVVNTMARGLKYAIEPTAAALIADYIGNDLERIEMELQKLTIAVPISRSINADDVRSLIGISKEFSVYEYIDALSQRNTFKAFRIGLHMGRNEKNNPFVLTTSQLFAHFSRVMLFHSLKGSDAGNAFKVPGVRHQFAAKSLETAAKNYTIRKAASAIRILREFDARFKGVEAAPTSGEDLMKELTFRVLHA